VVDAILEDDGVRRRILDGVTSRVLERVACPRFVRAVTSDVLDAVRAQCLDGLLDSLRDDVPETREYCGAYDALRDAVMRRIRDPRTRDSGCDDSSSQDASGSGGCTDCSRKRARNV
jgi:hypothetical protein